MSVATELRQQRSLPVPRGTDHAGRSKGGTWTLAPLELGAVHFCLRAPLDLETAGGPQQGMGMWVQEPFYFGGSESVGWFTPDRSLRSILQRREQDQRGQ